MAERRMFNKTLMSGNLFTALNKSAQLLYMYLNLQADDDGICGNTNVICRMCGCGKNHLQTLIDGGWLLDFEGGEVAITHWHIHNQIRKDRYKASLYTEVKARLRKREDGVYEPVAPDCQNCENLATQERIEKDRKEKVNIDQHRQGEDMTDDPPAEPVADSSPMPPVAADDIDIDYDKVLEYYQILCKDLVPCERLTPKLRKLLDERAREGFCTMSYPGIFCAAAMSDFLTGRRGDGRWKASLQWLLDPVHIREVRNGKYSNWY